MEKQKIVVLTGAGVSAESGLKTFRDSGGLWHDHSIYDVATPEAWSANPELVLNFYNERRRQASAAQPNAAHQSIANLESRYNVVVITQNVDDLHERAGSSNVIHVHGELTKARSSEHEELIYSIGAEDIKLGDLCEKGAQLRPHIVWFGEQILHYGYCVEHMRGANKVLVVGTSLSVYPAAGLLDKATFNAEKIIVALELEALPKGYKFLRSRATNMVPHIVECWLKGRSVK